MQSSVIPFMRTIIRQSIVLLALSFSNVTIHAATLWQEKPAQAKPDQAKPLRAKSKNARYLHINQDVLNNTFSNLHLPIEITLPVPNGLSISVILTPSPILSTDLAEKYPHFMTYQAQQIDNPNNIGRFSISHLGLFGFFRYQNRWMLLSPKYKNATNEYASYWYQDAAIESDLPLRSADFLLTEAAQQAPQLAQKSAPTGAVVRTYKLAISTTAEYTQRLGGTLQNVVAELMNLVNRVNQVLLVDLALQFELIDNQNIIFFDANSDPYSNSDAATDIEANQVTVDQAIGSQNYDIGHVLGTNGGGLAYLGVVCNSQFKAQGYTGLNNPQGERFHIDLVAHELGHQLGAGHSFNATNSSSCAEGQRDSSSAYEPGSGSTIMSYAGICDSQNLQHDSDPYFHSISIQNIRGYVDSFSGRRCGVDTAIDNAIPHIVLPQNSYTIPANTPFVLNASVTDADDDLLTYTWEQFDNGGTLGATSNLNELNSDNGNNPLFRSYSPVDTAQRYFPQLTDVLLGQVSLGETYATTDRNMHFRLTARDNKGGVNQQDLGIIVASNAQTFSVDTPTPWQALFEQTVTWDIGDTLITPINCANVDILLIADANNPLETTILTQTPNDGQQKIRVPKITSSAARLLLKCSDNVFYALSEATFTIIAVDPVAPIIESQVGIILSEDSHRKIDFADLNVSDPDSAYPQEFTLTVQDGDNYSISQQTLTPDSNFNGALSVPVVINDGVLDSNVFTLQIQVEAVNDAPVIVDAQHTISLREDTPRKIDFADLNVFDPDSAYPQDFTLTVQDGDNYSISQQTLTPNSNFNGTLSVPVIVSDGALASNVFMLQIQVEAVNDAPVIADTQDTISLSEDSQWQIHLADLSVSDSDSAYPQDFTLTILAGDNYSIKQQTLIPDTDYNGALSVLVVVNDGELDSNIFTFTVQIEAVNDAPIANDDVITVQQNAGLTTIDVLANDSDVEMDTLSIVSFSYAGQGQVAVLNQQLTYTPAAQFIGSESISYVVSDGTLTAQASLKITVNAVVVDTSDAGNSGGGSMLLLSFLSFLCFSVKLCTRVTYLSKDSYE